MKISGAIRRISVSLVCFISFLFLLCLAPAAAEADYDNRDILILHSYHPGLAWTAGINKSVQEQLSAQRPELTLHVEYMDTKRNPAAWYRDSYLENVLVRKLTGHRFKLIISSDNDAFNFLLRHRDDLFIDTPIVFCGVNGFTPQMLADIDGITGVAEAPAFTETIELALHLHPDTREIIVVGETLTATGQKIDQGLHTLQSKLNNDIKLTFWNDLPLEELSPRLKQLKTGQIILLASVITDQHGRVLSYTDSARQVRSVSSVPIYGAWDFFLGQGIIGGLMTSSETQGQQAAQLALRIMSGEDASSISVSTSDTNRYMFDYNELVRFKVPLEKLPENSHIINRPSSYYELDKWQLWAGIVIIALLGLSTLLLLNNSIIRRKNEKVISERTRLASLAAGIGRALTSDATLHQTLQLCCESLLKYTGTTFGRIWVVDENDSELLELHASAGQFRRVEMSAHRFKRFGELKVGVIASERRPILTNQVQGDPLFADQDWIIRDKIVGFAGYPLIVHDRVVGVIAFFSKRPLTEQVQHAIASEADMIAVGIERYRTRQALQKAVHDAEAGRDNIDAILRSVADGLIVTDLDHKIVLINDAAEKLLSINFTQVFGMSLSEATKGCPYAEHLQNLLQNSDAEVEFSIPDLNGSGQRTIHARISTIHRHTTGNSGTVAILHDVTRLRELDRMKSEFIATAAHELRTPLCTIQGYAELMYRDEMAAKMTEEQRHEYLGYIISRSEALEHIIDNLLDVGRAETGRTLILERTPCEMFALVHEIISHHRLESPTHTFIADCPATCLQLSVDRNMMHRVFDNLLSNAVKYSPVGGTIRLSGAVRDDNLMITVKDEGLGMTPGQIDQAFNKFYRVDPSDTAVRGLGLGLTICKAIIEAHSGTIWIDSHSGQGTEVHFCLPLSQPEGADRKRR